MFLTCLAGHCKGYLSALFTLDNGIYTTAVLSPHLEAGFVGDCFPGVLQFQLLWAGGCLGALTAKWFVLLPCSGSQGLVLVFAYFKKSTASPVEEEEDSKYLWD